MITTADAPQVKLEDLQELARMILCLQGDERAELANELAQAIGRFVRAGNIEVRREASNVVVDLTQEGARTYRHVVSREERRAMRGQRVPGAKPVHLTKRLLEAAEFEAGVAHDPLTELIKSPDDLLAKLTRPQ
jgi:hypothetical protein